MIFQLLFLNLHDTKFSLSVKHSWPWLLDNSFPTGTYTNTHLLLQTHIYLHMHMHTGAKQLREEWQWLSSVIGSELQLQQKAWSCRKPVSVWHLLLSFSTAGQHSVRHLGWDIILLPSSPLSNSTTVPPTSSATTNNTSVSAEATEMTCLSLMKILHCTLNRVRDRKRVTSGARQQWVKKSRGDTDTVRSWLIPTVYQTAISEHRVLFI